MDDDGNACIEARRRRAIAGDALSEVEVALGGIWDDLVTGRRVVVDHFTTEERLYLLLERASAANRKVVPSRELHALQTAVVSGAVKVAAAKLGTSQSSMVSNAKKALSYMGLPCRLLRAPAILLVAAHAAREEEVAARVSELAPSEQFDVVSIRRLEHVVESKLSPGERSVLAMLVEGNSHAEIAVARGTSERTVANQLATAFRKVGGSGRLDVIRRLLELAQGAGEFETRTVHRVTSARRVAPEAGAEVR